MKKLLPYLFLLLGCPVFAQQEKCEELASGISDMVKQRNYSGAYQIWNDGQNKCLAAKSVYPDMETSIRFLLDNAKSESDKDKYVSALATLFDEHDRTVPGNAMSNKVKKAMLFQTYRPEAKAEIFALLDAAYTKDKSNFKDPQALVNYFEVYNSDFTDSKKITSDALIERYISLAAHIDALSASSEDKSYKTAAKSIRAKMFKSVSCEMLTSYFSKNFESHKDNLSWMQHASVTLMDKNCVSTPEFLNTSLRWHSIAPSSKSAYNTAVAYQRVKDKAKTKYFFSQAADLETDPQKKAEIYYILAANTGAKKEQSVEFAKKAIAANPSFGKAYFLMAQHYSNAPGCGKTEFEKKALNFLAAKTAERAGIANPQIKKTAQAQMEKYLKNAPQKSEIKAQNMAGVRITYDCWINETVTVPEL